MGSLESSSAKLFLCFTGRFEDLPQCLGFRNFPGMCPVLDSFFLFSQCLPWVCSPPCHQHCSGWIFVPCILHCHSWFLPFVFPCNSKYFSFFATKLASPSRQFFNYLLTISFHSRVLTLRLYWMLLVIITCVQALGLLELVCSSGLSLFGVFFPPTPVY